MNVGEKEDIKNDMDKAVSTLRQLREENTELASRLSEKRGEADALRENKGMLQKTLLDQISTLRERVYSLESQLAARGDHSSPRSYHGSPSSSFSRTTGVPARSSRQKSPTTDSALKRQVRFFLILFILFFFFLIVLFLSFTLLHHQCTMP